MPPRSAELLWPFECRTCHHNALVDIAGIRDPQNWQVMHRCPQCGYVNVLERSRLILPVQESLEVLPKAEQHGIREALNQLYANPTPASLRTLLRKYVAHLDELVAEDPAAGAVALLLSMRERENSFTPVLDNGLGMSDPSADLHAKVVTRATDLLYVLLARNNAPVSIEEQAQNDSGLTFLARFSSVASDAAAIALQTNAIEAGLWNITVQDRLVITEKTELHSRLAEWDLNRREFHRVLGRATSAQTPVDLLFTQETLTAERLILGYDSTEILELAEHGFGSLRDQGALHDLAAGRLWVIDPDRLDECQRRLLHAITLNLDRVRRFATPFYFDLGATRASSSDDDLAAVGAVLTANWANYYPIYEVSDHSQKRWLLTSKMPLLLCLGNMATFRNRLFGRTIEAVDHADRGTKAAIRRLQEQHKTRLENVARDVCRARGWDTLVRLKNGLRGQALPCGEIDLLLARRVGEANVLVLLAEVKDFDVNVVSSGRIIEGLREKLGLAFRQLDIRAEWARREWKAWLRPHLLRQQDLPYAAYLLPLVITADYMPPFMFDRYVGVPVAGLSMFLAGLEEGNLSALQSVAGDTLTPLDTP
jgi:hypothetical protein